MRMQETHMAKKKPEATEARALVDLLLEGESIPSGKTFSASAETIAALVADGRADAHPEAVAAGQWEK